MTSGHVFRVENPAVVFYPQKVGHNGQLTTASVTRAKRLEAKPFELLTMLFTFQNPSPFSACRYLITVCLAVVVLTILALSRNWWGLITNHCLSASPVFAMSSFFVAAKMSAGKVPQSLVRRVT